MSGLQRPWIREERWSSEVDGRTRTAVVDVLGQPGVVGEGSEIVEVSYELLAQMLTDLGFTPPEDTP